MPTLAGCDEQCCQQLTATSQASGLPTVHLHGEKAGRNQIPKPKAIFLVNDLHVSTPPRRTSSAQLKLNLKSTEMAD